jgi:asparagine synthetase A
LARNVVAQLNAAMPTDPKANSYRYAKTALDSGGKNSTRIDGAKWVNRDQGNWGNRKQGDWGNGNRVHNHHHREIKIHKGLAKDNHKTQMKWHRRFKFGVGIFVNMKLLNRTQDTLDFLKAVQYLQGKNWLQAMLDQGRLSPNLSRG